MEQNTLVLTGDAAHQDLVAGVAARLADDLGLILTRISLTEEKVSGGRIEEERAYGGQDFQAFDEPVFIGAAIAQLAGHLEVVVVDDLAHWIERLYQRFPDDPVQLEAEIQSLHSIMAAHMAALLLVGGATPAEPPAAARHAALVEDLRDRCEVVLDLSSGEEQVQKGSLDTAG